MWSLSPWDGATHQCKCNVISFWLLSKLISCPILHRHTLSHRHSCSLVLCQHSLSACAFNCLPLLIQIKTFPALKSDWLPDSIQITLPPNHCPVIRSVTRWKPWWGSMEWTPSRCSWPIKIWWCWGTRSSTKHCKPVRTSEPSHVSTLRMESWWPRC